MNHYSNILGMPINDHEAIARLKRMPKELLTWYSSAARKLQWRSEPTPYRVWVSEIMLQQTRVSVVIPYFERFVQRFPDVCSLAEAPNDELMKHWEGLGYYGRARNLKKAAKEIMEKWNGEIPSDFKKLKGLPGIGEYTAGAIASIAYGRKVPVMDGNVLRILSRILAFSGDILDTRVRQTCYALLGEIVPQDCPGDFNQAMMELGATICVPNRLPDCEECPAASFCEARVLGIAAKLPNKNPPHRRRREKRTIVLVFNGERVLLRQRQGSGLLAGLWEFLNFEGKLDEKQILKKIEQMEIELIDIKPAPAARHVFSHIEWDMTGFIVQAASASAPENCVWADRLQLEDRYPIPSAFSAYRELVNEKWKK